MATTLRSFHQDAREEAFASKVALGRRKIEEERHTGADSCELYRRLVLGILEEKVKPNSQVISLKKPKTFGSDIANVQPGFCPTLLLRPAGKTDSEHDASTITSATQIRSPPTWICSYSSLGSAGGRPRGRNSLVSWSALAPLAPRSRASGRLHPGSGSGIFTAAEPFAMSPTAR